MEFDPYFTKLAMISTLKEGETPEGMFKEIATIGAALSDILVRAIEHGYAERSGVEVLEYMSQWVENIYEVVKDEI